MKNTMINSNEFYAGYTPLYHLVYPDWGKSIKRQANRLDSVIHEMWGAASEVLDVSCGIGTQTLGLAGLGYVVTASDLSSEEVNRTKQETALRELSVDFSVADTRGKRPMSWISYSITRARIKGMQCSRHRSAIQYQENMHSTPTTTSGKKGNKISNNNSGSVLIFLCKMILPKLFRMHTYIFLACRSIPQ
jgi:SAM-dependent methyltransferase